MIEWMRVRQNMEGTDVKIMRQREIRIMRLRDSEREKKEILRQIEISGRKREKRGIKWERER
jgi:hypothetical protein